MNLIERVLKHVRSVGHATQGAEHQLLLDFAQFLSSEAPVMAFLKTKNIKIGGAEHAVVSKFIAEIAPEVPVVTAPVEPAPEVVVEATPASATVTLATNEATVTVQDAAPASSDPQAA